MSSSRIFKSRLEVYYAEREAEFIEYTTAYLLKTTLAEYGYAEIPETVARPALAAMYAVTQDYWQPDPDAASTLETLTMPGLPTWHHFQRRRRRRRPGAG